MMFIFCCTNRLCFRIQCFSVTQTLKCEARMQHPPEAVTGLGRLFIRLVKEISGGKLLRSVYAAVGLFDYVAVVNEAVVIFVVSLC